VIHICPLLDIASLVQISGSFEEHLFSGVVSVLVEEIVGLVCIHVPCMDPSLPC